MSGPAHPRRCWRNALIGLTFALWSMAFLGDAGADGFVTGVEDLPLMPGLVEDTEAALVFDEPGGRLVEAYAYGPLSADEVTAFYSAVLPELGWRPIGELAFLREGEMLRIGLVPGDEGLVVQFVLSPE